MIRISTVFNGDEEYIYAYFDIAAMPKGFQAPTDMGYISFLVKNKKERVARIGKGYFDR